MPRPCNFAVQHLLETLMSDFESEWKKVVASTAIKPDLLSPHLIHLIKVVHDNVSIESPKPQGVQRALIDLLSFLSTPEGATNPNYYATDIFFALVDGWNMEALPDDLVAVIGYIGGALHDVIRAPEIARMYFGLPEQLLDKLNQLNLEA